MTDPRTRADTIQRDTGGISGRVSSGWIFFAATILFIVGSFNVLYGLTAIFKDEVLTGSGTGSVIVWDVTGWGWIHLLLGIVMILTALGLFSGQSWARWTAVFFCMVNAITQVALITVFPLWTILIVTLDIIIIYQLTARWEDDY
ncbi:MAG TPA: hypothetical protein VJ689_04415 [Gaiellaceae bacterium]|nr:hypothetical protein [Gaiellaceae bacterium]